jgi:hypothetical protein
VQLSITGKGGKVRQVLLPERARRQWHGETYGEESRHQRRRINALAADAHGSHAIDRLPEVQATLGHGNISE